MFPVTLRSPRRLVHGFRSRRLTPTALALLGALVILAGCASGNTTAKTGNTGNTGNTGKTTSATATTAPTSHTKPTAAPQVTMQLCQSLVSLSDVNTVTKPAIQANTIVPINDTPGGSCAYLDNQTATNDFTIYIQPFQAGASFNDTAQLALSIAQVEATMPSGVNASATPISGVGDQALFASYSGALQSGTGYLDDLVTTTGSVLLSCFTFGSGSPGAPQQPALTQLCSQVVGRV